MYRRKKRGGGNRERLLSIKGKFHHYLALSNNSRKKQKVYKYLGFLLIGSRKMTKSSL